MCDLNSKGSAFVTSVQIFSKLGDFYDVFGKCETNLCVLFCEQCSFFYQALSYC